MPDTSSLFAEVEKTEHFIIIQKYRDKGELVTDKIGPFHDFGVAANLLVEKLNELVRIDAKQPRKAYVESIKTRIIEAPLFEFFKGG